MIELIAIVTYLPILVAMFKRDAHGRRCSTSHFAFVISFLLTLCVPALLSGTPSSYPYWALAAGSFSSLCIALYMVSRRPYLPSYLRKKVDARLLIFGYCAGMAAFLCVCYLGFSFMPTDLLGFVWLPLVLAVALQSLTVAVILRYWYLINVLSGASSCQTPSVIERMDTSRF